MAEQPLQMMEYAILQYADPGAESRNIGILLLDRSSPVLYLQTLEHWAEFDEDAQELLSELAADIQMKACDLGPVGLMDYLTSTLSNNLLITTPISLCADDPQRELQHLFQLHIVGGR